MMKFLCVLVAATLLASAFAAPPPKGDHKKEAGEHHEKNGTKSGEEFREHEGGPGPRGPHGPGGPGGMCHRAPVNAAIDECLKQHTSSVVVLWLNLNKNDFEAAKKDAEEFMKSHKDSKSDEKSAESAESAEKDKKIAEWKAMHNGTEFFHQMIAGHVAEYVEHLFRDLKEEKTEACLSIDNKNWICIKGNEAAHGNWTKEGEWAGKKDFQWPAHNSTHAWNNTGKWGGRGKGHRFGLHAKLAKNVKFALSELYANRDIKKDFPTAKPTSTGTYQLLLTSGAFSGTGTSSLTHILDMGGRYSLAAKNAANNVYVIDCPESAMAFTQTIRAHICANGGTLKLPAAAKKN